MDQISFQPPLDVIVHSTDKSNAAFLFTHGEKTDIEDTLFVTLAKNLRKTGISSVFFRLPFRMKKKKFPDHINILDNAFLAAWKYAESILPDKKWFIGGHSVGAATALRVSSIISDQGEIPPVVAFSYPMFPTNRPEAMNVGELHAIMGPVLFCTGDKGKRGTHQRLETQLAMMANFAHMNLIKGGNHELVVPDKDPKTIAYWLAKDIETFLSSINFKK